MKATFVYISEKHHTLCNSTKLWPSYKTVHVDNADYLKTSIPAMFAQYVLNTTFKGPCLHFSIFKIMQV